MPEKHVLVKTVISFEPSPSVQRLVSESWGATDYRGKAGYAVKYAFGPTIHSMTEQPSLILPPDRNSFEVECLTGHIIDVYIAPIDNDGKYGQAKRMAFEVGTTPLPDPIGNISVQTVKFSLPVEGEPHKCKCGHTDCTDAKPRERSQAPQVTARITGHAQVKDGEIGIFLNIDEDNKGLWFAFNTSSSRTPVDEPVRIPLYHDDNSYKVVVTLPDNSSCSLKELHDLLTLEAQSTRI